MARALMAICVLVALVLPTRFTYGRPAINDEGSILNAIVAHNGSKSKDLSDNKENAAPSLGNILIPVGLRQRRWSDQRRAELEALVTLSKVSGKFTAMPANKRVSRKLDVLRIGRRKRTATGLIALASPTLIRQPIRKAKRNGDPVYPLLIS